MNKLMKLTNNNKGMTLVEVLIAFSILVIIAAAFLLLFSTSVVNIFNFGAESRSVANTAETMEAVYNIYSITESSIIDKLDDLDGKKITDPLTLYVYDGNFDFNYYIESSNTGLASGYDVTLVTFYRQGEKYVDLTSFVKEGD